MMGQVLEGTCEKRKHTPEFYDFLACYLNLDKRSNQSHAVELGKHTIYIKLLSIKIYFALHDSARGLDLVKSRTRRSPRKLWDLLMI